MATLQSGELEHPYYTTYQSRWLMIRDVLAGKRDIDLRGETYLPKPSDYTDDRYKAYQTRAVFYNATARTLEGYQGAIFRKEAEVTVPSGIEYIREDADGQGNTLTQFAKQVARDVIPQGRCGVMVDFPSSEGIVTLADERENNIQGHFAAFSPETILNWGTVRIGAKTVLSFVIVEEGIIDGIQQGDIRDEDRVYLKMYLDESGEYVQERYKAGTALDDKGEEYRVYNSFEKHKPTQIGGKPLHYIPFIFIGSETFSPKPNTPPFYDLAQLNLAHYRNSADFEQSVFMIGQPTSYITGLDKNFIEENKGNLTIGSSVTWLLPDQATVGLLESKADRPLIKTAMDMKEQEMVGLGARIIQDATSKGSEAAESVHLRRSGEASQLACVADNISDAFEKLFTWLADWIGSSGDIRYRLNKDFYATRLSHQDVLALITAWQSGAISHSVLLNNLRGGEIISELKTNEDVMDEIEEEGPAPGMEPEAITPVPGEEDATESGTPSDT